jgi:hypothetical protein
MKKYLVPGLAIVVLLGLLAGLIWFPKSKPVPEAALPDAAGEESGDEAPGERLITIESEGKPAQVCRVLREWDTEDGSTAQEVEVVETGERMTLIKKSASTSTDVKPDESERADKP